MLMWPDMLPDGSAALVTLGSTSYNVADAQIGILTLAMGELELLFSGSYPRYSRSGHIVYHRDGSIWAAPFDVEQRRLTGEATPVVQGIWANGVLGRAFFALSDTGTLLYGPGTVTSAMSDTVPRTLVWVDRDGKEEPVVGLTPRSYVFPRLSPDERQIVVDDNGRNLWLYDVETQLETEFTFSGDDRYPIWSADGSEIIFASTRNGPLNLYSMAADRTGEITRLTDRSGSVCLNNFPRYISGLRADCGRCRVVHGVGRRMRRPDGRRGPLGAHREGHLTQPPSWVAARPGTFQSA